jgi:hypothetical protein
MVMIMTIITIIKTVRILTRLVEGRGDSGQLLCPPFVVEQHMSASFSSDCAAAVLPYHKRTTVY